jgi:signal transduction histidine kinase
MMKLKPETIDLNRLVEQHLEALQAISSNHRLIWQPVQVPLIHADGERVLQVVNNFVSNAAKYSSPGTPIILTIEDLSDKVKLSVKDEGPGIPDKEQPFLFERYYRGEYNAEQKGFGLGLYICAEIIKQHHGFIGVQSTVGQGSTFYFTIPYT